MCTTLTAYTNDLLISITKYLQVPWLYTMACVLDSFMPFQRFLLWTDCGVLYEDDTFHTALPANKRIRSIGSTYTILPTKCCGYCRHCLCLGTLHTYVVHDFPAYLILGVSDNCVQLCT